MAGFDVVATVPVVVGDDLEAAPSRVAATPRSTSAGWAAGSRTSTTSSPAGWATATPPARSRTSTWPGSTRDAAAAVPFEFIDRTSLLGPADRIAERLRPYADAGVTTLSRRAVRGEGRPSVRLAMLRGRGASAHRGCRPARGRLIAWTIWQAIVLGIVEGLTEFLPISSTGHLTIAEKLLGLPIDDPAVTAYTAMIQVGAIAAMLLYFAKDIARLLAGLVRAAWSRPTARAGPRLQARLVRHRRLDPDRHRRLPRQGPDHRAAAQPVGRGRGADPVERRDGVRRARTTAEQQRSSATSTT